MKCKHIVFTKLNTAEYIDTDVPPLADDEVRVKTEYSTISCGTEKANITGDMNLSCADAPHEASFPRYLGYSLSGIVCEIGKNVKDFKIGDKVSGSWTQHKLYNNINIKNVVKFDDGVQMNEAALAHIFTFPMAALRKTKVSIGESAMVMGLGILGLAGVMLYKASGATPVIAVDPNKERLKKALKCGADYVFDPTEEGYTEKIKEITGGGVKCAIEVTGLGIGLNQTLDCMAKFGRIALLGCTRDKNFTVDYYRKVHGPGITLIGAHTLARPDVDSSDGWFTQADDIKTFHNLVKFNRISLKDFIDREYSPSDCGKVYGELINSKDFPAVVQFNWKNVTED